MKIQGIGGFYCWVFSLQFQNVLNKAFHPGGAVLLHLVCDVAVDIQREGGGGVAQVALDSLDVIAAFYRGHGISVSKLVEAENEGILMEVENGT